jgi:hypothetical protein
MRIMLSPMRCDEQLTASVSGETITLNGTLIDLSSVAEGDEFWTGNDWVLGPVTRVGGQLRFLLMLPYGPDAPEATKWSTGFIDTPPDGPLDLPSWGPVP